MNNIHFNKFLFIEIVQLDNYNFDTNSDAAGYFDKERPDRLLLDIDYVNMVENESSDPDALISGLEQQFYMNMYIMEKTLTRNFSFGEKKGLNLRLKHMDGMLPMKMQG
ncbi:hypothetical protein ACOCEA_03995 [Maribacter sp. CXY002]|uniref:hypothetical protein n=1 Tax=Maribacter luteocoastalis TaxID=3407671 RepID=UPI003B67E99D